MAAATGIVTFLFTDIEGSTRLWESDAARMEPALARHDAIVRDAVETNRGTVVKMTGDGVHAVFDDPLDAVAAALHLQLALAEPAHVPDLMLAVRCGIHMGVGERRDRDFFGPAINRAARIMAAAHGGQVLLSQAVATLVADRLRSPLGLQELGEVRLRDLASAERLFQLVHPRLRAQFPPLRSLEATPNNLPQQLTSFIGRERQLAEVAALIPRSRLLTLVGPGGIGKTRLSLQAAADAMEAFADGVFFIEFAPLGDALLLAQAVASALGVKEEAGRPLVDTLADYVRERHLLLIFDNCEHLVQGCAALAHALLRASAMLHIVASSREPLNIAGEQIYPVPTLSLPQPPPAAGEGAAKSDTARRFIENALKQSEAARLFIERAMAARGDFLVNDDNAVAIVGICRQLDGIPLAIELAAACTRTMSPARIEDRLSDRFRLLAGGNRDVLPRQQTLRALIDWSYDLLVPAERTLFRHLAVFAGGFTLEAAESLTRIGGADADAVLDVVTGLVEKSLVVFDADKDRYGFLETVREYALGRLRESAEEAHARTSHLAWVLDFVKHARDEITGPEQARCLARLDAELENVLAAHAYCSEATGGGDADMRLADAIKLYWFNRGLLGLGLRVTTEALARPDAAARGVLRARLLLAAGQFKSWAGRFDEAYDYLEEGLAIAREAGDAGLVATLLQPLGLAALGLGRRADARAYLDEALTLARQGGDPRELAAALNQIAQVERIDGRMGRADEHYRQALVLAREAGDLAVVAVTLLNLAMTAISRGEQREPVVLLHETLAIAATTGDRLAGLGTLDACTALAASLGEMRDAVAFHGMAEAQLRQSGMQRDPVDTAFVAPWLDVARGRLPAADFAAAEDGGRALGYAAAVDAAKSWLMRR